MNTSTGNISSTSFSQSSLHSYESHTKLLFTIFYTVNLILGLPTNVYALWLILTGAGGLVASEFFTLNLAVSEILYCLLSILVLLDYYLFSGALFLVRVFSSGFISSSRPLFQCCICIERYLAVVHPMTFLRYRPLRYRVVCSGLVWLGILGSCLLALYLSFSNKIYYCLGQYLAVFLVNLFCCLSVLQALKRPGPGEGDREREGTNNIKRKALSIIRIILLSMVVSCLPVMVILPLQSYMNHNDILFALSICFAVSVAAGFVQPLLYLHRAGKLPCIRGS